MSTDFKISASTKPSDAREQSESFIPLSFRALCLLVSLLVVIPGLFKLGVALSRAQLGVTDTSSSTFSSNISIPYPSQSDLSRPFHSQRSLSEDNSLNSESSFIAPLQQGMRASEGLGRLEKVIASAGVGEQQTAAVLKEFALTGAMAKLRELDRKDVELLAEYLAMQLSPAELGSILESFIGLPAGQLMAQEDPKATLMGVYDAIAGNRVEEIRPSTLMVTDQTQADGRITGQSQILPVGTRKVYAVFENDRALQGLDQVLAVWRNPSDDRMVFTEFEPIRRGSAYNYVWLEVDSGWPEGQYQVELFHPEAQSLLLASEGFSIR